MAADRELARKLHFVANAITRLPYPERERILRKVVAGHDEHREPIRQIPTTEPVGECYDLIAYTALLCEDAGIPATEPERALVDELLRRLLPAVQALMHDVDTRRKTLAAQEARKAAKSTQGRAKPAKAEKPREKLAQRKRGAIPAGGPRTMSGNDARALRESLGLTQEEMAERVGAHEKTVSRLERKGTNPLTLEMQRRYAKAQTSK